MKLLIDTHIFLWWMQDSKQLPSTARELISDSSNIIFLSIASLWEIVIKKKIGKLSIDFDALMKMIKQSDISTLNITPRHVLALNEVKTFHKDPCDHMLVAQAHSDRLTILTHDQQFKMYDADMIIV